MRKKYLPALRVENAGRDEIDLILEGVEGEIYRIYREAAVSLRDIAEEYLREFIRQDSMLRKAVQDGDMAQEDYNRWRISHMATGRRWFEASETMAMNMTNYNQIAASTFGSHLPEVYTIGFNSDLYGFEQSLGFMTSFTMFDISTVERLIRENPALLPRPRVDIPKDMQWNRRIIASEMTQAVMQGETIDKIAARLSDKCAGMNQNAAIRNARTAFTSAENGGRNDNYRRLTNAGIKAKKTWIATLDARTRESHRWVDGQTCDSPEEEFSNGLLYPGDPDGEPEEVYNCRCTMITTYAGADPDVMKGSRSSTFRVDDGNGSFKDVTYQEWKGMKAAQSAQEARRVRESMQGTSNTSGEQNAAQRSSGGLVTYEQFGRAINPEMLLEMAEGIQYQNDQISRSGLTSAPEDGIMESEDFISLFRALLESLQHQKNGNDSSIGKEHVENRLVKIGFKKIDDAFFSEVDSRLCIAITDQLEKLESIFGAIRKADFSEIRVHEEDSPVARVRADKQNLASQIVSLSAQAFGNSKLHIKSRRRETKGFYCMPCKTDDDTLMRYVITHEYGHMLENALIVEEMKGTKETFNEVAKRFREEIVSIALELEESYSDDDYLSERGFLNDRELFAECFANSQLGEPNILGFAMSIWLERRGF